MKATSEYFLTEDPIIPNGTITFETDTGKVKTGNGLQHYSDLPYWHVQSSFLTFSQQNSATPPMITSDGGFAILLTNKTGVPSVKGTVVIASFQDDKAFTLGVANSIIPIGVVYTNNAPDGAQAYVTITGTAKVLLKDGTEAVRGNWVGTADIPGRAIAGGMGHPGTKPNDQGLHNQEIGHCLESKTAGTNVLALVDLHFN